MNPRAIIVPLAVAASLGLAACGGDDDKELSKSDLAKKANAICKTSKDASGKIAAPADITADPVAAAAYFNKIVPITQKQTDDFKDLKPDDDAKADWNQLVARQEQALETLKGIRDKAEAKDPSGVQDLAKAQRVGEKFAAEATAVGADTCASG